MLILLVIVGLAGGGYTYKLRQNAQVRRSQAAAVVVAAKVAAERSVTAKKRADAAIAPSLPFNRQQFSNDDPGSVWVVANKQRPLQPKDYAPNDLVTPSVPLRLSKGSSEMLLRQEAATALENLIGAGNAAGVHIMLASAYRSYSLQVAVYGNEVKNYGQAVADSESARPGFSEHQTGLAADLEPVSRQCEIADCFADTPEGKWLAINAGSYGFLLRYPSDKVSVTGYRSEAWHYRYINPVLSAELHKQGSITLEEFFGLPSAPAY